jgi:hypothetical protein
MRARHRRTPSLPASAGALGPRLLLLLALLTPCAATGQESDPGAVNPIQNPDYLTIFPVNDIATLRSQRTVSSSDLLDFVATNSALTSWSQTGQILSGTDPCTQSLGRRLLSGRVTTPAFEQAICMTPLGLSLFYGKIPGATGQFLGYQFPLPGLGTDFRNFDAQTGLFDRTAGTDQLVHMDIATAHRNLQGKLTVSIIGYDSAAAPPGRLVLRASWTDTSTTVVTGDVALAVGDYNGDGSLDILVWADTSTGAPEAPGRIDMASFAYDPAQRSLRRVGTLAISTPSKPASIVAAAGDFATIGTDQALMAYYPAAGQSPIKLSYFQLNADLQPAPPQIVKDLAATPAPTSYFDIDAGLFAFDPSLTSSTTGSPGFHTRQLALSWVDASGKTRASIVAVKAGGGDFTQSGSTTLGSSQYVTKSTAIGPSLGAGNFIGLQNGNVTPTDQIAVAIPTIDNAVPNSTITELVTATVSYNSSTATFSITPTTSIREPAYSVQGLVYGPGLAALDSLGRAFFLGNPAHIRVPVLIDPQYVVYMPPHHVDCLPVAANPNTCEIVNISALGTFNVTLSDAASTALKQESTNTSSTDFAFGSSIDVSQTVSSEFLNLASLSTTTQVKNVFSYETNSVKKDVNSSYQTMTTQKSATTNIDDQVGFNQRVIDIWRYPVFSVNLGTPEEYPYYEIVIPGPLLPYQSDGLTVSWFNPDHINNNALSYPTIGSPSFPQDLGTFTYQQNGTTVSKTIPLNDKTVRSFAGNSQTYDLAYTQESGSSSERSYNYSMSNTLDISTGFSAEVGIGIVNSKTTIDSSLTLTNASSWGTSTVASRSMSESRGITLNQPSVTGIQTKAYNYQTLIYISSNGGLKVAHAVDFLAATGQDWWRTTYHKADPALNLPLRLVQSGPASAWKLNPEDSYYWMRGISLTSDTFNEETKTYPAIAGGVDQGEKVRVLVNVYNLSLGSTTSDTQVQLAYQALDPNNFQPVGPEVVFATSATLKLPPLAVHQVVGVWDTGQLSISRSTPYRFVINLLTDPNNDLHGASPSAGGNNRGVWPYNGSGIFVFPKAPSGQQSATASFAAAPDGTADVSLDLVERRDGGGYFSHDAVITLKNDTDHRGAVLLVVSRPTGDPDGRETVLASRMIYGLPAGTRTLRLGIPRTVGGGVATAEVMADHVSGRAPVRVRLFSHYRNAAGGKRP